MVGGWVASPVKNSLELDFEILQKIYEQMLKEICEVPGCKLPMHLMFCNKRVCFAHWSEDWKSINLKKVFGVTETSELTIEYLKKKGLGV
jgi:hypothetical protein